MEPAPQNTSKDFPVPSVIPMTPVPADENPPPIISQEAFIEQAITDFQSPLIAYASALLHDVDRARDVVQDTFIRLCQQPPERVREQLKSWLFTVCRNRAMDILRKERNTTALEDVRWKKVAGPGLQPDESIDLAERHAQLMAMLERLSPNQREVILLKFQQGLSYQEIHQITGLTTTNIGFLIHAGLKRLRDLIPKDPS